MVRFIYYTFFFIIIYSTMHANFGGSYDVGNVGSGNFKAVGTGQVEIADENLAIELHQSYADVHVKYRMHNTGDDIKVKAGFPGYELLNKMDIIDYRIKVNDKNIDYKYQKGKIDKKISKKYEEHLGHGINYDIYLSWLVSAMDFKKDETKTVDISYVVKYFHNIWSEYGLDKRSSDQFVYLLSTGAAWKGPIKHGIITIKPLSVNTNYMKINQITNFKKIGDRFVWEFSDLEPAVKDDMTIDFGNSFKIQRKEGMGPDFWNPDESINPLWTVYYESEKTTYLDFQDFTVTASSALKDAKHSFDVKNIHDNDRRTVWVPDKPAGESLTLTLKKAKRLNYIGIIPGSSDSTNLYFQNNRVKKMTIILNDDNKFQVELPDEYNFNHQYSPDGYQFIELKDYTNNIKTIKLIINDVYKGSKYDNTCISEIILRKKCRNRS